MAGQSPEFVRLRLRYHILTRPRGGAERGAANREAHFGCAERCDLVEPQRRRCGCWRRRRYFFSDVCSGDDAGRAMGAINVLDASRWQIQGVRMENVLVDHLL